MNHSGCKAVKRDKPGQSMADDCFRLRIHLPAPSSALSTRPVALLRQAQKYFDELLELRCAEPSDGIPAGSSLERNFEPASLVIPDCDVMECLRMGV